MMQKIDFTLSLNKEWSMERGMGHGEMPEITNALNASN
jgi:hypothetical protein